MGRRKVGQAINFGHDIPHLHVFNPVHVVHIRTQGPAWMALRASSDWTQVELSLDFRVLNSHYEPSLVLFCMLNRKDSKQCLYNLRILFICCSKKEQHLIHAGPFEHHPCTVNCFLATHVARMNLPSPALMHLYFELIGRLICSFNVWLLSIIVR